MTMLQTYTNIREHSLLNLQTLLSKQKHLLCVEQPEI
jgi:hypothetical protein